MNCCQSEKLATGIRFSNKTGKTSILFLVDDITQFGGIRTRVTEQLRCVKNSNRFRFSVISQCHARNARLICSALELLAQSTGLEGVRGFSYAKIPHGGVSFMYKAAFAVNLALSIALVVPWCLLNRPQLVYGHNIECGTTATLISRILGIRCIIDLHGVEIDEYLESHPRKRGRDIDVGFWRRLEKSLVKNADLVICVSDAHREVLEARTSVMHKYLVIPCFSDESEFHFDVQKRTEIRSSLGIGENETLFIYTGTLPPSSDVYSPFRLFSGFQNTSNKRLLVLATKDSFHRAEGQIPSHLRSRVIVMSVSREEVPGYLSAADVALLLRRRTVVNQVASPTKFSEYLLCGLPVIITEGVGDASSIVRDCGIGIVLSADRLAGDTKMTDDELVGLLQPNLRNKARQSGELILSQRSCCRKYIYGLTSVVGPKSIEIRGSRESDSQGTP